VGDVVRAIESVVRRDASGLHPATRTFQALRIAVNREPEHLERGLSSAIGALAPRGRLGVISFHSGEERAVKQAFSEAKRAGRLVLVTAKGMGPTESETRGNPRASSARLRVAEATAQEVGGTGRSADERRRPSG